MSNRVRFWETAELKKYNLIDTSARKIKGSDLVTVRCRKCPTESEMRFTVLVSKMTTYGHAWQCPECRRLENSQTSQKRTGTSNPFFGRKHSNETRQKMKAASRARWDNTPQQERQAIGESMRRCAYEKYGGNPMASSEVRAKWAQAVQDYWSSDKATENIRKRRETCIKKYGASTYVHSDDFINQNKRFTAKAETEIIELLGLPARKRRRDGVELDIYIESKNLAIEYNGAYWHSELYKNKNYHLMKTEYCELNGINLIQIFDHEWEGRRKQVESFLYAKTGKLPTIGARKCDVVQIENKVAQKFMDEHHIQGAAPGSLLCLALTHEGEIVCVGIFGRHHRQYDKVVLKRFATKSGVLVSGALSRISKAASRHFQSDIITWADRRFTSGKSYMKAGWEPEEVLPPDYFYIKNGRYHCSKQARRKSAVNTPQGMTEHEHALQDKLFRVYDSGKIRFIYRFKSQ